MSATPLLAIAGLILAVLLPAARADAAAGSCAFNSTVGVNFGAYDVFNPVPTDSTGSLTYTCIGLVGPITIELNKGGAPSYHPLLMQKSSGETLSYNLYLDAARVSIWGNGNGGTSRYGPVTPPLGSPVTVTIYGRIPARQNVSAGSYRDTIRATINF